MLALINKARAAAGLPALTITSGLEASSSAHNGHRMNILSSTFTHIGIAVSRDSSGTVWLTQDFSN